MFIIVNYLAQVCPKMVTKGKKIANQAGDQSTKVWRKCLIQKVHKLEYAEDEIATAHQLGVK